MKKIIFTGTFWEWLLPNLGLSLLTILTLGIAGIYQMYWNQKYFFSRLVIEG